MRRRAPENTATAPPPLPPKRPIHGCLFTAPPIGGRLQDCGMISTRTQPQFWLSHLADLSGSTAELRRLHQAGSLVRLRPGVYMRSAEWSALRFDDPYRVLVMAAAQKLPHSTQFSHDSAAVMWGLPSLGKWSSDVHVLSPRATGGRSLGNVKRHCVGEESGNREIDGLRVTSLARTLVDTSCSSSFLRAVGMIDAGMREPEIGGLLHQLGVAAPTKAELFDTLDALLPLPGSVKARVAIGFGDGRSQSPLESLSRGQFFLLGMPAPELQVPFYDSEGFIGFVDFYWRELDLIGESDGDRKYAGADSPSGRPGSDVVKAEKNREDRLRRVVKGFVRWDWDTAISRDRLADRVRPFGLVGRRG